MKLAIAATLALLLAACATTVGPPETIKVGKTTLTVSGLDGYNSQTVQMFDPNGPNVFVTGNAITIDQEPVRPAASQGRVTIVWRLDASSGSPYSSTRGFTSRKNAVRAAAVSVAGQAFVCPIIVAGDLAKRSCPRVSHRGRLDSLRPDIHTYASNQLVNDQPGETPNDQGPVSRHISHRFRGCRISRRCLHRNIKEARPWRSGLQRLELQRQRDV